jgi:hypothetical protein
VNDVALKDFFGAVIKKLKIIPEDFLSYREDADL